MSADWHTVCSELGWSTVRGGVMVPLGRRRHRVGVLEEAGHLRLVGPAPHLDRQRVAVLLPRLLQRNSGSGFAGWQLDDEGQPIATARVRTDDAESLVLALREVAALADRLEVHLADEDLL